MAPVHLNALTDFIFTPYLSAQYNNLCRVVTDPITVGIEVREGDGELLLNTLFEACGQSKTHFIFYSSEPFIYADTLCQNRIYKR